MIPSSRRWVNASVRWSGPALGSRPPRSSRRGAPERTAAASLFCSLARGSGELRDDAVSDRPPGAAGYPDDLNRILVNCSRDQPLCDGQHQWVFGTTRSSDTQNLYVEAGLQAAEVRTSNRSGTSRSLCPGHHGRHPRVMASAAPGEIVVSRTIKDLLAGSGLQSRTGASTRSVGLPTSGSSSP